MLVISRYCKHVQHEYISLELPVDSQQQLSMVAGVVVFLETLYPSVCSSRKRSDSPVSLGSNLLSFSLNAVLNLGLLRKG